MTKMPRVESSRPGSAEGLDRDVLVLGGVFVLGAIMTVLDLTVVNVAIPTLGRAFDASITAIQWVVTGYMLAFASVIPLTGWASERFGAKRVWLGSLLLFLAGSVLAGAAWSLPSLIGFRVLQGLGAGMILPVGQTILAQAAGPARMGRVMSVIGVPMLLAPVFGPVLGGAIVDSTSWRWIFYLNLPVGALALLAAQRLLPEARPQLGQRLDLRGFALLSPGIALFLYGISEAGNAGGFTATTTVATVAGIVLVGLFVRHALVRGKSALIDLSLFRRRGFAAATVMNFLLPVALFGALILLPLYYQVVRHQSPLQIGLLLVPQGVGAALAMPLAGKLTDTIGARVVVAVGVTVAVLGTLAYTQVGAATSYVYLAAALFVWHARTRGRTALIDISLFARRGFASAVAANFLLPLALFGSLILLPLYYQVVRREPPLQVGLLLMPQGLGAALVMPFAGFLTDRIGARLVVSVGVVLATIGALGFTQIGAGTSYVYLAAALFVLGLGAGSTIMPSMAAAFQTLARDETPRGTSALNAAQRIGGAVGTALLAIVLQRAIAANLPELRNGIQALATLSPGQRAHAAPQLADAFGTSFWVAAGLIAATLVPALLLPVKAGDRPLQGQTP